MDPTTTGRRRLPAPVVAGIAGVAIAGAAAVAIPALAAGNPADAPAMRPVSATKYTGGDAYGSRGDMFVLTDAGWLQRYDRLGAGKLRLNVPVTGLAAGERLVGIDTRPANGQLYGVGSTSRLYVIDPASGAATAIGTAPFTTALAGNRFGVDFNPTVDRLRIVSDTGQNLRIDPTTGAVAGVDTNLSYDGGGTPSVTGAGYTNSVAGATSTALYDIDTARDTLVLQGTKPGVTPAVSPNTGKLFPVGKLGIDVDGLNGFEIVGAARGTAFKEGDYTALAAVKVRGEQKTSLVRIDLRTGKATRKAKLTVGVAGLTASAGTPVTALATTADNRLVRFDRSSLKVRSRTAITGLAAGEKILGIDVRPANGQLYLVGSTNRVYTVNTTTGAATAVGSGPFTPALSGTVGVDFNPTVDRLRIVTSTGQNLRINPDTGAVAATDKNLAYAADDRNGKATAKVSHAAYTNNFVGATSTKLYDIDTALDILAIQDPPNDGTLRTVGRLKLDAGDQGAFDISANGVALAALTPKGADRTRIYSIDLATGQVRQRGTIGADTITGLAIAPRGV